MRIYDCFIYSNESDLLKLRMELLGPYVDTFIIVEGLQDHRGKPRTLRYDPASIPYNDKVRYYAVNLPNYGNDDLAASQRENYQRHMILYGLYDAAPTDCILFGDADEIVDPRYLDGITYHAQHGPLKVEQYLSYYAFNLRSPNYWYGTTVAIRQDILSMPDLRNLTIDTVPYWTRGGWHASYCGSIEAIQEKLSTFCHADLVATANNNEHIDMCRKTGIDMFGRGETFSFVPLDDTFPPNLRMYPSLYVKENTHAFMLPDV